MADIIAEHVTIQRSEDGELARITVQPQGRSAPVSLVLPFVFLEHAVGMEIAKRAAAKIQPAKPARTLLYGADGVTPAAQVR